MIHHLKRATRHLIFWTLVILAIGLTGVRLVLSSIDHYKVDLSVYVSELLGAPVTIGHLQANMRGYSPEVVLHDIKLLSINEPEPPPIQLKEIRLGINLIEWLRSRDQLAASRVTLVGAKVTVKRKLDGTIALMGLKASDEKPLWLLQGGQFQVLQSDISWQDELNIIQPITLTDVNLAMTNHAQQHQVNALIKLPKEIGKQLTASINFQGNFFESSTLDANVYIEGHGLKPSASHAAFLPLSINVTSGLADFKSWLVVEHSQLKSVIGDVQLQEVQLNKPDKSELFIKRLTTQFNWQKKEEEWTLRVPQWRLDTVEKQWPDLAFNVFAKQSKEAALHQLGLFTEALDLEAMAYLVDFFVPLPKEQAQQLKQAQLKGTLEQWSVFLDLDQSHFAVNGKFNGINIAPSDTLPGIENLTGYLKGTDQDGRLLLATQSAKLLSIKMFRQTLDITTLAGALSWQQTPTDIKIESPKITFNFPDIKTQTRFNLHLPKVQGQSPFLDLQANFSMADVGQAHRYLPVTLMGKNLVEWLDRSLVKGRIFNGQILCYGALNDFPFRHNQGIFEVPFQAEELDLKYLPEWPVLGDLSGRFLFLQSGLEVDLTKGSSKDVHVNQARIVIPDLDNSEHILVHATLEAEILEALKFMQETPIKSSADNLLNAIEPKGHTLISLDLKLPLIEGLETKVDGAAQLAKASLNVKSLDLEVTDLIGDVNFNEHGIYSQTITGVALNNPIKVNIKNTTLQSTVYVAGRAGVNELQKQFKLPGWRLAQGATDYRIKLNLPHDDSISALLVESNLSGMSLDFPGYLAKTREQQRPLSLQFNLSEGKFLPIVINYDNQLKAAITYDLNGNRIASGNILIGAGDVDQRKVPGMRLEINRERLDLQDWLGLAVSLATTKDAEATGALSRVNEVKVHSEHGLWKKVDLGLIDVTLKPEGNYWMGNIDSSIAKGSFSVPNNLQGSESINLKMAQMDLSALKQFKAQVEGGSILAPEYMPLITVSSQKTHWQGVDLGELNIETERILEGIAFKRFELIGENQSLILAGDWKNKNQYSETQVQGTLSIPQAGRFFSKLDLSQDFTETNAQFTFKGNWKGAPYQFALEDVQGQIGLDFKNGRILGIEPGFGRVLGFLAVAQWVKRVQLDFSDVFGEGLSFTGIKGQFDLLAGTATTKDLMVDAVPAKIAITGYSDLIDKTVDFNVHVVPKSADAVPVAGTIMGKLTDFIGLALTGKDQQGFFFGSQYVVKGAWGNVQIIPLHENDGLLQKTWDGLTGFSWLKQTKEQ